MARHILKVLTGATMKPRLSQALVPLFLALGAPAFAESPACFLFPGNADEHTCTCGPGPYPDAEGDFNDVWGSAPYTSDSDICRAAQHAGVIGPEGGEVTAIRAEGPEGEWRGSTANGVTSYTTSGVYWDSAFTFEGAQAPEPLPNCGPLGEAEELACFCPYDAPRGEVWGSGPYTADSDICAAAYHAGVIDPQNGGNVRVIRGPGQDNYTASTAAAVTTSEHGPAEASFTFGSFE
jgi:hypothetical protein